MSGTRKDAERDFWSVAAADGFSSVSDISSKPLGSPCEDIADHCWGLSECSDERT